MICSTRSSVFLMINKLPKDIIVPRYNESIKLSPLIDESESFKSSFDPTRIENCNHDLFIFSFIYYCF